MEKMPEVEKIIAEKLKETENQLENAKKEVQAPFMYEEDLRTKNERLEILNALLSMDEKKEDLPQKDDVHKEMAGEAR